MVKILCHVCGLDTDGRGRYSFTYLSETVWLCGSHAQRVMRFIKEMSEDGADLP